EKTIAEAHRALQPYDDAFIIDHDKNSRPNLIRKVTKVSPRHEKAQVKKFTGSDLRQLLQPFKNDQRIPGPRTRPFGWLLKGLAVK
ncbi:MAG TPA: hypothetical protein VIQ51_14305, partial [Chryseosolibacter sp.]